MLIQVTSRHFVAGVVTRKFIVIRTVPILRYMIGWHITKVKEYCGKKNWKYNVIRKD